MKLSTCPLDYYGMNNKKDCKVVGTKVKAKNIDFAGFTEVRSSDMTQGLKEGLIPSHKLVGKKGESPQGFNTKRWKLLADRYVVGNEGVAGITPTLGFVIGRYQNIKSPRKIIKVISTHFVPLTLHGRPRPDYVKRWNMWQEMWRELKRLVTTSIKEGITIFVIGDFNHSKADANIIKQIHPKAKWIIKKGLDWIFVVEGKVKIKSLGEITGFDSGSDHKAYIRDVYLRLPA